MPIPCPDFKLFIGMLGPPLLPAIDDHLGIHWAGFHLLPVVIGAATPPALRLAANALLESVRGRIKASLAIWAAMGRRECAPQKSEKVPTREQNR
jgi:hypothetical protein